MEPIEEHLKQAMNRVDPPVGFVARVMARVAAQAPAVARPSRRPRSPWLAWWQYLTAHPAPAGAMVLVMLVALAVGVGQGRRPALSPRSERERMEGEKAKAQMLLALKITGAQLSRMQELLSNPANGRVPGDPRDQPGAGH
jgi:hypothetical protein